MTTDFDHAADVVRQFDKDRYLSALLAPEAHRNGLMALYAYNAEISRIRELVSEPLPGEVRLQWWRDLLEGTEHGAVASNPVANALLQTIDRYELPKESLVAMAEDRRHPVPRKEPSIRAPSNQTGSWPGSSNNMAKSQAFCLVPGLVQKHQAHMWLTMACVHVRT